MSKHETPMTLWYWNQLGGQLVEEFMIVKKNKNSARRLVDGLVILNKKKERLPVGTMPNIVGEDIVIIQAKNNRLGMNLMGQTLFSKELILKFKPRSVISIALCKEYDDVLGPMLEKHEGCKVVVCPKEIFESTEVSNKKS